MVTSQGHTYTGNGTSYAHTHPTLDTKLLITFRRANYHAGNFANLLFYLKVHMVHVHC